MFHNYRTTADNSMNKLCSKFIAMYWRSFILILWPIVLAPLIIINDGRMYKCLYVVALMAMYWVTETLPLPITGMIPIVLYPLMGILSTSATCDAYINDTTMMFFGSLVIAVVIENSGLHMRVALLIIKLIGCSHRKYEYILHICKHINECIKGGESAYFNRTAFSFSKYKYFNMYINWLNVSSMK